MENDVLSARGTQKDTTSFYVEQKDGYGNIERQLNFDNPKVCPRKGLIELIGIEKVEYLENAPRVRKYEKEYLERMRMVFAKKTRRLNVN